MLDFTSALYLGLGHPSASLAPWRALTLGRPAALEEPPGGRGLARDLALLMGGEAGLLYPSTLHLFRDLFQVAASKECHHSGRRGILPHRTLRAWRSPSCKGCASRAIRIMMRPPSSGG